MSKEKIKPETKEIKTAKKSEKKPNIFARFFKKLGKICKDTYGEMRKVVWTPKAEVTKNTKLVVITVIAIGIAVAIIDTTCALLINSLAGIIG